jgi:hypothetical protein
MKTLLLIGVAALLLATLISGTASACGCCFVNDPTGTPLNVRDKPNGKIIGTVSNKTVVDWDSNNDDMKDSRGRLWRLIFWGGIDGQNEGWKEGWVFRKYLMCGDQ